MIAPCSDSSLTRRAMLRLFVQQEHSFVSSVGSSFCVSFLTGSFKSQKMIMLFWCNVSSFRRAAVDDVFSDESVVVTISL